MSTEHGQTMPNTLAAAMLCELAFRLGVAAARNLVDFSIAAEWAHQLDEAASVSIRGADGQAVGCAMVDRVRAKLAALCARNPDIAAVLDRGEVES